MRALDLVACTMPSLWWHLLRQLLRWSHLHLIRSPRSLLSHLLLPIYSFISCPSRLVFLWSISQSPRQELQHQSLLPRQITLLTQTIRQFLRSSRFHCIPQLLTRLCWSLYVAFMFCRFWCLTLKEEREDRSMRIRGGETYTDWLVGLTDQARAIQTG
jgi:hypothetical protein